MMMIITMIVKLDDNFVVMFIMHQHTFVQRLSQSSSFYELLHVNELGPVQAFSVKYNQELNTPGTTKILVGSCQ